MLREDTSDSAYAIVYKRILNVLCEITFAIQASQCFCD